MRIQKQGVRNGEQRIVIIFSDKFHKHLSIPLDIADKCVQSLRMCKNVDDVNKVLVSFGLEPISDDKHISLDCHVHKILQRRIEGLDYDDLYQELFLKGLEVLNSSKAQELSGSELWAYVKKSLENHLKDLLIERNRKMEMVFSDLVDEQEDHSYLDEIISPYMNVNKSPYPIVKFINPEDYAIARDLVSKIKAWASLQNEDIRVFFNEYFDPSEEVLKYLDSLTKKKTWKNRGLTPISLGEALINTGKWKVKDPRDKWLRIRDKMLKDLNLTA
jgi:hypothetical protein